MGSSRKYKVLLNLTNIIYMICGALMTICGYYLFMDTKRILLSRLLVAPSDRLNNLPQPLFYYIAVCLILAGIVAIIASIIGMWATCLSTYCFLSIYFLIVVVLLLAETVICLAITIWPHCLGINLDESKMVKALQSFYGIPGKEQFTIAVDLAQTRFGCCGMSSEINYDTSIWKVHEFGQKDWIVPLSCCILDNPSDHFSHLDPKPANESQCQASQKSEYQRFRYTEPCLKFLQDWYREHYTLFLSASSLVAIVEFAVLLTIVFTCTKNAKRAMTVADYSTRIRSKPGKILVENIYEAALFDNGPERNEGNNTITELTDDFKETYVQPRHLYKQRHNTTFKPVSKDYPSHSRNYLS